MIGFINTLVKSSLNYGRYSAITDLHNLQFTVAHALGFAVFASRLLATKLKHKNSNRLTV
jgi:redox-regulated HSP33 family molecular chaperone